MYSYFASQRNNYKLVEKLITGKYRDGLSLLKALVTDIVNNKEFEISGGRVWELDPATDSYQLKYQYGNADKIPEDYRIKLADHKDLSKLITQRVIMKRETDELLQKMGITLYSMTGVGEVVKLKSGKYYNYVLGFNAPEILQSFYDLLTIISSVASVALRNLTTMAETEKIMRDINTASEIQRNLLPDHSLRYHDYDIFGVCVPDSEVGGDYFDYLRNSDIEDERLGVLISDAASKGLPAATQSLFVSGAIRMGMGFAPRMSELFARLNTLVFDTFPYERFVTVFYCELTLSSNRLVLYCNAGHCEPIHYRPESDEIKLLGPTGGLLGIIQKQKFGVENIRMHPGDILLLYTDGISEALSKDRQLYGTDRLYNLLRKNYKKSPKEIAYLILDDVAHFAADSEYTDDRTLVVIKRDLISS